MFAPKIYDVFVPEKHKLDPPYIFVVTEFFPKDLKWFMFN